MRLYENEAKRLFAAEGIAIPKPLGVVTRAEELAGRKDLAGPVMLKSLVLIGGRAKAGGVRKASGASEAASLAGEMLGREIRGYDVERLLAKSQRNQPMAGEPPPDELPHRPQLSSAPALRARGSAFPFMPQPHCLQRKQHMSFHKNRQTRRPSRRHPFAATYRPGIESLEDRRLLSAGDLDLTFGNGGLVNTTLGSSSRALAVATYPNAGTANDGKIVAAGDAFPATGKTSVNIAVAWYNLDGTLDPTFGGTGR